MGAEIAKHDKFIMLVGAGASCDIGYPTLDDLFKQASIGFDGIDQLIRKVDLANTFIGRKRENFEVLIEQLQEYKKIAHKLRTDYVLSDVYKQIPDILENETKFAKALTKCYSILADRFGPDGVDKNTVAFTFLQEFYKKLAELNTVGSPDLESSLHVYTTNYDCAYQVMASNFNDISFMTHISNATGKFREEWNNIRPDLSDVRLPEIFIHRLHGCVTWYNMPADSGNTFEKLGAGGGEDILVFTDEELQNMCVKVHSTQLLGKYRIFSLAFEEFYQQLNDIDILIVWGYSFHDFEVTNQINQALMVRKRNPFKIYYIDPYLNEFTISQNIINTLGVATVQPSPHFKPEQIKWTPYDGRDTLTARLIEKIENCE